MALVMTHGTNSSQGCDHISGDFVSLDALCMMDLGSLKLRMPSEQGRVLLGSCVAGGSRGVGRGRIY